MGVALGLLLCIVIGAGMIGAFYGLSKDVFAKTEYIWEGVFGLLASVVITIMGAALLRVSKLQDKWRVKLAQALESKELTKRGTAGTRFKQWAEKYAMFILPFITVLREGLEAVVFIGGVSLSIPASSFPLAVVCGLACGAIIGYLIYRLVTSIRWPWYHFDSLQGRQPSVSAILPDLLHRLLIPCCCWAVLEGSWVL